MSIRIGSNYKLTADGKIVFDHKTAEAKLDVSKRRQRKSSKRVRVVKRSTE